MSRTTSPNAVPITARATVLDYFLILAGCGLSLALLPVLPLAAAARADLRPEQLRPVVEALPGAMRMTEGIILLWPLFLCVQMLRGRGESPTAAEWLWIVSWLGVATLTGLGLWEENAGDTMPALLRDPMSRYAVRRLWYVVLVPALGLVALCVGLASALGTRVMPWTHSFALALIVWPALLMGAILALGTFV